MIYCVTIFIFSVINQVLGNEIENNIDTGEEEFGIEPEYKDINNLAMNIIMMFRNAIGDYQIPSYKYWSQNINTN